MLVNNIKYRMMILSLTVPLDPALTPPLLRLASARAAEVEVVSVGLGYIISSQYWTGYSGQLT